MRPGEIQAPDEQESFYFFLSHAHPQSVDPHTELDYYVRAMFRDLSDAVSRRPRKKAHWSVGLFRPCADPSVPPDRVDRALASTAVFVALRSECYDSDGHAAAERSAFYRQSPSAYDRPPQQRLLPVLWEVPASGATRAALDAALTPLPDVPEYAEIGLVALCRRQPDRDAYERVLAFLSEWIIDVAEGRRMPGDARWAEALPRAARPAFVIASLRLPTGFAHGTGSAAKAPTSERLRQVAAQVAEYVNPARFDVHMVDVSPEVESLGKRPGVLVVDGSILGTAGGRSQLRQILGALPAWVQPLVVPDLPDAVRRTEVDVWSVRRALAGVPERVPRPRIMTELDDPLAVITAAIDRAIRHFDDEHLAERRYPPRPRSNSHPEE